VKTYDNLKIFQVNKLMDEAVEELKDIIKCKTAFLDEFERIDHVPQVNSIEMYTVYDPNAIDSDVGTSKIVAKAEDLIPTHIKRIKDAIQNCEKVYVRCEPEISVNGIKVGIYTRLISIT